MNVTRLTMLVALLRNVEEKSFSLVGWTGRNECGTTACAVGHAAQSPEFNAVGLSATSSGQPRYEGMGKRGTGQWTGWAATEQFFDLSEETAGNLFYSEQYPAYDETTTVDVIGRINLLLTKGEQEFNRLVKEELGTRE